MTITSLSLANFRNHQKREFSFDPTLTLVVGPNAVGKTAILEAIYLLARGESWRTQDVGEMVEFGGEVGHVGGEALQGTSSEKTQLHVTLTRGLVGGKRVSKTKFLVDGVSRRKSDFTNYLKVVLFEPESLEIIIGDPGRRRAFLDEALSQTNREHARSLGIYAKALRTRNRLLQAISGGRARVESLDYWEREMVKHGLVVQNQRQKLIEWLDSASKGRTLEGPTFSVTYDSSPISMERLDQYREREIATGFTLIGPQRDELQIQTDRITGYQGAKKRMSANPPTHQPTNPSLSSFGSRGQQRMVALKLKLLEEEWIEKETGQSPVILLDDIFSELDREHEKVVEKIIDGRQAIITTTGVPERIDKSSKIIDL